MYSLCAFFVSEKQKVVLRGCAAESEQSHDGCQQKRSHGLTAADVCVCKTRFCNKEVVGGAAMTSSCGHVIMAVALVVGAIFSRLM